MTGEACEALVVLGLVLGILLVGHLMVLLDIERSRRGRRRRRSARGAVGMRR